MVGTPVLGMVSLYRCTDTSVSITLLYVGSTKYQSWLFMECSRSASGNGRLTLLEVSPIQLSGVLTEDIVLCCVECFQ